MASPTPSNAHSLAESYMPLVRKLARWLAPKVRGAAVDVEELEADGFMGLVKAEKGYDPQIGVGFAQYAKKFILGAMRDGMNRDVSIGSGGGGGTQDGVSREVDPADAAELADEVSRVRNHLGREAYERATDPGLTGVAIAERAGISRAGASQRVSRARRLLDEMDGEEGEGCN
jgi:RNA polymerase sigma factor (sigma-70 family)